MASLDQAPLQIAHGKADLPSTTLSYVEKKLGVAWGKIAMACALSIIARMSKISHVIGRGVNVACKPEVLHIITVSTLATFIASLCYND